VRASPVAAGEAIDVHHAAPITMDVSTGTRGKEGTVQENLTWPRVANVILGLWLFISAFIWPHTYEQMTNTWIVGVLCIAFAVIAMRVPEVRYLNTILAIWLFISAWALPTMDTATRWNNALVAIAIFFCSLAPGYVRRREPTARP
jgi:hypothetical protein